MGSKNNFMMIIIVTLLSLNISLPIRAEIIQIHYIGHSRAVNSAYWNPDETIIASSSDDGSIIIWNSRSAEIIEKIFPGSIRVRWNSDGTKILASGYQPVVHIWDVTTLKLDNITISNSSVLINAIDWSNDDTQIVIGTNTGKVLVFDRLDGNLLKSLNLTAGGILDLDYNPVKDLIAVSYANASLIIWNSFSNETKRIDYSDAVSSLAWNRDGSLLVVGENTNVHFLSETGEEQASINNEPSKIAAFTLNNNESLIAAGSVRGIVNIWNLETNTKVKSFYAFPTRESGDIYDKLINSLDWNKDDKLLVTTPSLQFDLWDINTGINELVFGTVETTLGNAGTTFTAIFFLPLLILPLIRKNKKKFVESGITSTAINGRYEYRTSL